MFLNFAPFDLAGRRSVLLAPNEFSTFGAKTAVCYLRYRAEDVVAVVDPAEKGKSVEDVLGFGGNIPVIPDMAAACRLGPEVAIVGVAPQGGRLTGELHGYLSTCASGGIDIVSGLHDFVGDVPAIANAAAKSGAKIWDVRRVPSGQLVGDGVGSVARSVLTVGSDCNVGKMTATLEMYNEARKRGVDASWAATGQTGMMLRGRGIAVDRVVADFVSGAAEALVQYEGKDAELLFVEGQGSIIHPGYGGVTLGLMFGVMPDQMVIVHAASRDRIGESNHKMPSLPWLIDRYQESMKPLKEVPVVGVALNTAGFSTQAARGMIERTRAETGFPVTDPVRFGAGDIVDAVTADA